MIKIGNTLILNADIKQALTPSDINGLFPLTCGLSLRATVTASSIQDDGFTYCLQRGIIGLNGQEIPPQEFNVSWSKEPDDLYPYLALVTLLLLCGIPIELFRQLQF